MINSVLFDGYWINKQVILHKGFIAWVDIGRLYLLNKPDKRRVPLPHQLLLILS